MVLIIKVVINRTGLSAVMVSYKLHIIIGLRETQVRESFFTVSRCKF